MAQIGAVRAWEICADQPAAVLYLERRTYGMSGNRISDVLPQVTSMTLVQILVSGGIILVVSEEGSGPFAIGKS